MLPKYRGEIVPGFTAPVTFYGERNGEAAAPQLGYDPSQFHVRF